MSVSLSRFKRRGDEVLVSGAVNIGLSKGVEPNIFLWKISEPFSRDEIKYGGKIFVKSANS